MAGGGTEADCIADPEAEAANLPAVDSMSHWGLFVGLAALGSGNRTVLHASDAALIVGDYKLVVGKQPMAGWTGPTYPNNSGVQPSFIPKGWVHDCHTGCLFNVREDPTEHANLADSQPGRLAAMQKQLDNLNQNNFNPNRGRGDKRACERAVVNGGFYGPFVGL